MYRTLVGCNPQSAVDRELDDKLLIPNEVVDNTPASVLRALAKALQVHPDDRTKTILEFRQELSVEEKNAENTCDDSLESFMDNSEIFDQSPKKSVPFKGFKKNSLFKFFKKIPTKKLTLQEANIKPMRKHLKRLKKSILIQGKSLMCLSVMLIKIKKRYIQLLKN